MKGIQFSCDCRLFAFPFPAKLRELQSHRLIIWLKRIFVITIQGLSQVRNSHLQQATKLRCKLGPVGTPLPAADSSKRNTKLGTTFTQTPRVWLVVSVIERLNTFLTLALTHLSGICHFEISWCKFN